MSSKLTIKALNKLLRQWHNLSNIPLEPKTSVNSPLFTGHFNYCLDETNVYYKYGNFIDLPINIAFNKIQPAIRIADFNREIIIENKPYHLGVFTMATINGFYSYKINDIHQSTQKHIDGIINFFKFMNLDIRKLRVSYFGDRINIRNILDKEMKPYNTSHIKCDFIVEPDAITPKCWLNSGLNANQLYQENSKNTFLTNNWYVCNAPWGYRNEIHYEMENGHLLDIATIEVLNLEPIISRSDGENEITAIREWNKCIVVDGFGFERLLCIINNESSIRNITQTQRFHPIDKSKYEAIRILHRILADTDYVTLTKNKKEIVKRLIDKILDLDGMEIFDMMEFDARNYYSVFPDLKFSLTRTYLKLIELIHLRKLRILSKI
jgi:hypothetical protein